MVDAFDRGRNGCRTFVGLNNVRAALEWCFGENGDFGAGIRLAAAAMPIFQMMSLLSECHRWSERALAALPDSPRGSIEEMHLQAGLGISSMYLHGERDAARGALSRGFEIAEQIGDARDQLRILGPLHMFHLRTGEFKTALRYARRCAAITANTEDPAPVALGISFWATRCISAAISVAPVSSSRRR